MKLIFAVFICVTMGLIFCYKTEIYILRAAALITRCMVKDGHCVMVISGRLKHLKCDA